MSRKFFSMLTMAIAVVALSVSANAWGQAYLTVPEPGYGYDNPVQQVSVETVSYTNSLEQRVQALEASMTAAAEEKADDGWGPDLTKQGWETKVGGRVLFDTVNFAQQSGANQAMYGNLANYSEARQVRIDVDGKGYGVYSYKLQIGFADEDGIGASSTYPGFYEGWVALHDVPVLGNLKLGQSKSYFGMEYMTSARFRSTMEASTATGFFVPGYKVGLYQSNQYCDDAVMLQSGVYFGGNFTGLKQVEGDSQGVVTTLRSVWTPLYNEDARAAIHVGGGWSYNLVNGNKSFSARPNVHESATFLSGGSVALNDYHVGNIELAMVNGNLSAQSELFAGTYNQIGGGNFNAYGAYALGSWFLTGESRPYSRAAGSFGRVKPINNFWVVDTCGGCDASWGAVELVTRWDYLDLSNVPMSGTQTLGSMNNLTFGLNWHWNPNARMMFEYIHSMPFATTLNNGVTQMNGTTSTADILGMRFQVDF